MNCQYFFDIPVYRLTKEAYEAQRQAYIEANCKTDNINLKDYHFNKFGGCWRYNEIIGYIRLHFLGDQIRGEYFRIKAKRITKTRKKTFEFDTWNLAPEIGLTDLTPELEVSQLTNDQIYSVVKEYIDECRKELSKHSYIDTEVFDNIGEFIDWVGLYKGR
ncbi:hypothetical protein KEF85_09785 [Methylomonas paludis]|uniref:Uncharacterized protein n=1 Tax=Methylomonas paludis TaxID=1173101 RepID=A0A975MKV5_9GAMM|nr:hypothetical protein [Methylomonas paludis]QWF69667.1 hypothetical protein KEF85_09785 [Methylomonas paludis]